MSTFIAMRRIAVLVMASACFAYVVSVQSADKTQVPNTTENLTPKTENSLSIGATGIASRLTAIEKKLDKQTESWLVTLMPAIFGLIGVLLGGTINYCIQNKLFKHQKKISENRAKFEVGNSFVQWQLKQLSELYGPLRALLGQSNAIYRRMNEALERADGKKFRLIDGTDDFDKKEFQIYLEGDWRRFRTVLHLNHIYSKPYGVEGYFDELVGIGNQMVNIIMKTAGYARSEEKEINSVFGKYLAHFAVLKRLHADIQSGSNKSLGSGSAMISLHIQETAVFPQEIQQLVNKGFEEINCELRSWRNWGIKGND